MQIDLTIKNYRCFADLSPARITIQPGFTGFLGANNSGKSTILKFFYEFRALFRLLSSPTGNLIEALRGNPQPFSYPSQVTDPSEIFCNLNERNLTIELKVTVDGRTSTSGIQGPAGMVITVPRGTNGFTAELKTESGDFLAHVGHDYAGKVLQQQGDQLLRLADLTLFFAACDELANAQYIGSFRNPINVGATSNYYDIDVGQAFIARWASFKAGQGSKAANVAAWRVTREIRRIFGFKELEINTTPDQTAIQLIIDGQSYRLDEQGSGIAQFVIVMANVATRRPTYLLIDEPEIGLHPPLQIDFLTSLAAYSQLGMCFATHNLGLARSVANRLYSVRRVAEGHSEVKPYEGTPDLPEFLGELSYSSYRDLGFERVLLVEGPNDLKTVQQWLRLYGKEHSVVLLPLGGAQMINDVSQSQLEEVRRITDQVFALIDSERPAEGAAVEAKRATFAKSCKQSGIDCCVVNRRAIENYLTDAAVKKVKGDQYRALGYFELLKEVTPSWSKSESWRIAREMSIDDLQDTDLGPFLSKL